MSTEAEEEGDLLARAREGDARAFGEIIRRYQRRVYGVARRIVRRHDLADDVVQETFLRAFQRLSWFDQSRPFGPWICRIGANLAINVVRSPRFREEELPAGHDEMPGRQPGPLDAVLADETRRAVADGLDALPAEQRAVLVLRAVEDLSYAEIASALGISEGTVMSRLFRARNRLAGLLSSVVTVRRARVGGAK